MDAFDSTLKFLADLYDVGNLCRGIPSDPDGEGGCVGGECLNTASVVRLLKAARVGVKP